MIFNNNTPIYLQLVEYIKMNIISGKYTPGEKLPSVRELASMLTVNPNTLQKALAELEDLHLIYTERTNGKYVTKDKSIIDDYKEKYAKEQTKKYTKQMEALGLTKAKIISLIGGNDNGTH